MKKFSVILLGLNLVVAAWLLISGVTHERGGLPPIGASVARLELLDEVVPKGTGAAERPIHTDVHASPVEDAHDTGAALEAEPEKLHVCFSIGPFAEENVANKAMAFLQQQGMATELRTEWHNEFFGYWVYLPPFPNREAALAVTRELKLHGIDDFFIVLASAKQNAISLGVYRNHETALALQKRLQSMDFKAELEKRMQNRPEFWLDYTGKLRLSTELLTALQMENPAVNLLDRACQ